ncbi:MAG: ATP-binding protein [Elusimicrobiota bacterium]|nr:ATP-binding protein [Elusimicrobiota bacterium]
MKQKEHLLEEIKGSLFKTLFDDSFEHMIVLDKDLNVQLVNKSVLNLLAYPLDNLIGKSFKTLLLSKDHSEFDKFLNTVVKNEKVKNYKFYLLTFQKSIVRLFLSAGVLKTGDDICGYYINISPVHPDDWAALKDPHLFQTVAKKLGRLTSIGQITSVFAHDIKNPLHVILSTSELLLTAENLDENTKTSVSLMERNAKRASKIVKTLLDFSRSGMCQLRPYSINEVVEYCLELIESPLRTMNVKVNKDLKKVPNVFLDPNYLNSVVYNLIANAMESLPEDGGEISVKSIYDKAVNEVRLIITDTGKGIDANVLSNIFRPFFTTKEKGTGLGLYLARQIMSEHSGKILIESKPHKGTIVKLIFSKIV